jgi:uncharacterized protein YprB with RNaseH-like and TPR domain
MSDIKDKLKLLKREREARARVRSDSVEETWERLQREERLSVKDKLEKLISLTGQTAGAGRTASLRRKFETRPREPFQVFENAYPLRSRYGKHTIGEGIEVPSQALFYLSKDEAFQSLDFSSALFFDLETTGLAGGTGTVAFLVGMGYYRDDAFHIVQYFLGELGEEERMIRELGRFFREMDFRSVITYNGKAFDIPLLETRFILQRERYPLSELPHLDLLFSARSLWKHKHESCRLFHLAQQIVEAPRSEDIPGAEIPFRYFDYLRSGDFSLIEPVLYHNQEDILSLLGLGISAGKLFAAGNADVCEDVDASDLIGVGKIFESANEIGRSIELFKKALVKGGLRDDLAVAVKTKLSYHFKKTSDWESAVSFWQEISESGENPVSALRELSMYFEHKKKDLAEAKRAAEEGLALATRGPDSLRRDFEKRIDRLNMKIGRKAGPGGGPRM